MVQSLGAMLRVFVQPADVYSLIRERSPVLWPMLAVIAVGIVSGLVIAPNLQELARQQLASDPSLPAEAAAFTESLTLWSTIIGGGLGPVLYALFTAAIVALGMLFTGGRLSYRQALSLALFSYAPLLLSSLLSVGMLAAGLVNNITDAVTSAALILGPEAAGTWPYRILDLIAPFEWWHIGLLAGGIRYLGDTSSRTAWTIGLVVWLLMYASVKILAGPPAF